LGRDMFTVGVAGENPAVVRVEGELDLAGVSRLVAVVERLDGDIELDCSGLTFIDAAGLGALVKAHRTCENRGAQLVVLDPSPTVTRLLYLAELDMVLHVRPNGQEA
jgi:anti-sigma B factor antagonist